MNEPPSDLEHTIAAILSAIRGRLAERLPPVLVALDGGSGSGKSTLAALIAPAMEAVVVPGDDFFAAHITDAEWEARTPDQRAADAIDWRRLRTDALEPLLAGQTARWHAFDFESGTRPDGSYALREDYVERLPATVIILEGAYSTRPELADLIDLSILVDVPLPVRHQRLARREEATFLEQWHARWDTAEAYYFTHIRPPDTFDLVITTSLST